MAGLLDALTGSNPGGLLGAFRGALDQIGNPELFAKRKMMMDSLANTSLTPEQKQFLVGNPKAYEEYGKTVIAPQTTTVGSHLFQSKPFGGINFLGATPDSDRGETVNPDGSKSPAFFIKPSMVNPSGGVVRPNAMQPQQPQPQPTAQPQPAQPRSAVPSGKKWWGDDEANNAGLYGPITSPSPAAAEEQKKLGATFGDLYEKYVQDGISGGKTLSTLSRMSQLNDKAFEGRAAPAMQAIRSTLASFGFDPGKVPAGEEFTALSNKLVLDAQNGSLGAGVSNADVSFLANIQPNMSHTIAGRRELIDTLSLLSKRKQEVARMAGEWRRAKGTMDGFDTAISGWSQQNPLFSGRENVATMQDRFAASGAAPQIGAANTGMPPRDAIAAEMKRRGLIQ
jgi:hypothetical protein